MRFQKCSLVALAILTMTMPVWAKTFKQTVDLSDNRTIGSTQLKPGSYEFAADDSKKELNISQHGKVIATVQGEWVKTTDKSQGIDTSSDKITEVRFHGSAQAFQLQ
jgi:hypothetical protein